MYACLRAWERLSAWLGPVERSEAAAWRVALLAGWWWLVGESLSHVCLLVVAGLGVVLLALGRVGAWWWLGCRGWWWVVGHGLGVVRAERGSVARRGAVAWRGGAGLGWMVE